MPGLGHASVVHGSVAFKPQNRPCHTVLKFTAPEFHDSVEVDLVHEGGAMARRNASLMPTGRSFVYQAHHQTAPEVQTFTCILVYILCVAHTKRRVCASLQSL